MQEKVTPMRVSPTDYSAATRTALTIIPGLYFIAGLLTGFSTRRITLTGTRYVLALLAAVILCNLLILLYQRLILPKAEAAVKAAIAAQDGNGFAQSIIRREMARIIQPVGGAALTIGFLLEIIVLHLWH